MNTIISQTGTWISFATNETGVPAEAHVIVSDTTGITIVADFHGFWRREFLTILMFHLKFLIHQMILKVDTTYDQPHH
jgi:hypothetical protein